MSLLQSEPTGLSLPPDPTNCRWEGHMADHIGATYGSKPLAFLSADADHLLLSGNRGTFKIPRASVIRLGRGMLYPWCFGGIRIRHQVASFPAELQFKPLEVRPREVLDRLRTLGYPVA